MVYFSVYLFAVLFSLQFLPFAKILVALPSYMNRWNKMIKPQTCSFAYLQNMENGSPPWLHNTTCGQTSIGITTTWKYCFGTYLNSDMTQTFWKSELCGFSQCFGAFFFTVTFGINCKCYDLMSSFSIMQFKYYTLVCLITYWEPSKGFRQEIPYFCVHLDTLPYRSHM